MSTTPEQNTPSTTGNPKRKKALLAVTALVAVAGIAYGTYYALVLNHYETTDNAYVQGNVVQITPQLGGTVLAVKADDTDFVKAGQLLVSLDPADAQVALDQAEAQLAQTVREVRGLYVNNDTLRAQIALREADLARARSDVLRAQDDVNRRSPLLATGAVGKEEFNHATTQLAAAKSAVVAAQSAVSAAREQLTANLALTDNTSVEQHPNVLRAAARVHEAALAVKRAEVVAPVDGYVARRNVQLGQRVQAGAPLMSVIPLNEVWVDANFKESQLRNLRIGQPVTLEADMYGKKVEYTGQIAGLGAGTGAAFALLPAQNATGNWIKVVQRVPVRVTLDARQLAEHPLRVGLSMEARVDTQDTRGRMLADASTPTPAPAAQPQAGAAATPLDADAQVRRIIDANAGTPARMKKAERGVDAPAAARRSESRHAGQDLHAGAAVALVR